MPWHKIASAVSLNEDCYSVFDVEDHSTMVADIATQKPPSVAGPAI